MDPSYRGLAVGRAARAGVHVDGERLTVLGHARDRADPGLMVSAIQLTTSPWSQASRSSARSSLSKPDIVVSPMPPPTQLSAGQASLANSMISTSLALQSGTTDPS